MTSREFLDRAFKKESITKIIIYNETLNNIYEVCFDRRWRENRSESTIKNTDPPIISTIYMYVGGVKYVFLTIDQLYSYCKKTLGFDIEIINIEHLKSRKHGYSGKLNMKILYDLFLDDKKYVAYFSSYWPLEEIHLFKLIFINNANDQRELILINLNNPEIKDRVFLEPRMLKRYLLHGGDHLAFGEMCFINSEYIKTKCDKEYYVDWDDSLKIKETVEAHA